MEILITNRYGIFKASEVDIYKDIWQSYTPSEYLKHYLIANLPVNLKEVGMEDETWHVLKANDGRVIWEEGQEECWLDGNHYKVIGEPILVDAHPFNPLINLTDSQKIYIERLCEQWYIQGKKEGQYGI